MSLLFFPASKSGEIDHLTTHCGEPAEDTKFIIQVWRRQWHVPHPLGYKALLPLSAALPSLSHDHNLAPDIADVE